MKSESNIQEIKLNAAALIIGFGLLTLSKIYPSIVAWIYIIAAPLYALLIIWQNIKTPGAINKIKRDITVGVVVTSIIIVLSIILIIAGYLDIYSLIDVVLDIVFLILIVIKKSRICAILLFANHYWEYMSKCSNGTLTTLGAFIAAVISVCLVLMIGATFEYHKKLKKPTRNETFKTEAEEDQQIRNNTIKTQTVEECNYKIEKM